jgi:hypothetical protein
MTLSNSTFTGNQSTCPSGYYSANIGALDVEFGAVATVSNCRFTKNLATGGAGRFSTGGALIAAGTLDRFIQPSVQSFAQRKRDPFDLSQIHRSALQYGCIRAVVGADRARGMTRSVTLTTAPVPGGIAPRPRRI